MNYKSLYGVVIAGIAISVSFLEGMQPVSRSPRTLEQLVQPREYAFSKNAAPIYFSNTPNDRYKFFSPDQKILITMPELQPNQSPENKTKNYGSVQQFYEALKQYGPALGFTKEDYYQQIYNALVQQFIYSSQASLLQALLNGMETECLQGTLGIKPVETYCSELLLVYRSDDTVLGVNENAIGVNWIGEMIMRIRKELPQLISEKEQIEKETARAKKDQAERDAERDERAEKNVYKTLDRWFGMSTFIDKFQQLPHVVQEEYFRLLALTHWLYEKVTRRTKVINNEEPNITNSSTNAENAPK